MAKYADLILPAGFVDGQRPFDKELCSALQRWSLYIKAILDGGIMVENMDADVVTFTSNAVANTEDAIAHGLGKVPTHFVVTSLDKGAVIYKGTTAFTKTNVYLKSTVASTAVQIILL